MYLGKIVEIGDSQQIATNPQHPYTRALFAAALPSHPDDPKDEELVEGEVPSALNPPSGCRFHPRCPFAMPRCSETSPELLPLDPHRSVACYLFEEGAQPHAAPVSKDLQPA
jgi:oligopeptide/dipeptide ABC transporter ATP-binding protein